MASVPGRGHVRRDARFKPLVGRSVAKAWLRRSLSVITLVAIDLAALVLGVLGAFAGKLLLRGDSVDFGAIWLEERRVLPIASVVLVLVFARAQLYHARERRGQTARVIGSTALATAIVAAFVIAAGNTFSTYYVFYASFICVSVIAVSLRASHASLTAMIFELLKVERRALLVGTPSLTADIASGLQRSASTRGVPYRVIGQMELLRDDEAPHTAGALNPAIRTTLEGRDVDEVIIAGAMGADAPVLALLDACRDRDIAVRLAPTATELLSHTLRAVPAPGLPLFDLKPPVLSGWAFLTKRVFDIVVAALILIVISPILLIAALAIKLDDGGPVFFRSRRVGVNEVPFDCLKLRTMERDAESKQGELEAQNEADGALFKIRSDPRVTRVGNVLRRFSIDELPQLFNVLRGEMSLVGPRPLPERDFALLDEVHKKRYLVLPGMTGLWQVSGRSEVGFDELVRLDFSYIESWSIWLDIEILLRTIPTVLFKRGAW
jgi:exopolysaccharide biosynthesis polyprenyl glycosylphosphotransferase